MFGLKKKKKEVSETSFVPGVKMYGRFTEVPVRLAKHFVPGMAVTFRYKDSHLDIYGDGIAWCTSTVERIIQNGTEIQFVTANSVYGIEMGGFSHD